MNSLMEGCEQEMVDIMTVRAPDNLQKALKDVAKDKGLTRNALILQILWEWLEKNMESKI